MADEPLLSIRDLVTEFRTPDGVVRAVDHVSFDVGAGETVGVVGESGSGKSVTALSVLGLVQGGRVTQGEALFDGQNLLKLSGEKLRKLRGGDIGMIFQDPVTSLNPVWRIGRQITEAIRMHRDVSKEDARAEAVELLASVGVGEAENRVDQYPHEFSGGMRQRVMIAMAIANRPKLLIADEPTTALDVTVQAQVLEVLAKAKEKSNASTILITHDLGLLAEMADRVVVMYCGRVVETGTVHDIFREPRHPYTKGLLDSRPGLDHEAETLPAIPGQPPSLMNPPHGCKFHPRCFLSNGREPCRTIEPELFQIDAATARASRCHYHEELAIDPGVSSGRHADPRGSGVAGWRQLLDRIRPGRKKEKR
ncbi:ABC transporter ATP-binding protein [Arthrobacter pigmenti]